MENIILLGYYRRTLVQLFQQVQNIYSEPWSNPEACLEVQSILIKRIIYIEKRNQSLKELIRLAKKELATKRNPPFTKAQSQIIKSQIKFHEQAIQEYRLLLFLFRNVGDALAFTYVSRWDVKPMIFKETAGYISGKSGFTAEKKFLRFFFQHGLTTILNDLTNSLRFGDLTVVEDDALPAIVEIKSSDNRNDRVERQSQKADELVEYLNTDQTKKGEMSVYRRESSTIFRDHIEEFNNLLGIALKEGNAFAKIESGLYYYIETTEDTSDLEAIIKSNFTNPPIVYYLNSLKYACTGYFPFTLSFQDPEALFDFYEGNIVIFILIDPETIISTIRSQGLEVTFEQGNDWILSIVNPETVKITGPMVLGRFFFDRVAFEFLSLDWILEETVHRAKNPPEILLPNQA